VRELVKDVFDRRKNTRVPHNSKFPCVKPARISAIVSRPGYSVIQCRHVPGDGTEWRHDAGIIPYGSGIFLTLT